MGHAWSGHVIACHSFLPSCLYLPVSYCVQVEMPDFLKELEAELPSVEESWLMLVHVVALCKSCLVSVKLTEINVVQP